MKMKRIFVLGVIAVIAAGCFQGNGSEMGPKETLESFYRNLCSGDFQSAEALCHKPEMENYTHSFRTTWEQNDSTITSITSDILSEMTINITDEERDGKIRTIFYELTGPDGQNKEKIATLRKEEGVWKIEAITDKH